MLQTIWYLGIWATWFGKKGTVRLLHPPMSCGCVSVCVCLHHLYSRHPPRCSTPLWAATRISCTGVTFLKVSLNLHILPCNMYRCMLLWIYGFPCKKNKFRNSDQTHISLTYLSIQWTQLRLYHQDSPKCLNTSGLFPYQWHESEIQTSPLQVASCYAYWIQAKNQIFIFTLIYLSCTWLTSNDVMYCR